MTGKPDGRDHRSKKGFPKKICAAKIFWEKEEPTEKSRNNLKIVSDKKAGQRRAEMFLLGSTKKARQTTLLLYFIK